MSVLILSAIVVVAVALLIFVIVKYTKVAWVKVLLIVIVIVLGLVAEGIGLITLGAMELGKAVNQAVEEQKKADQEKAIGITPKTTDEKKERKAIFEKDEVAQGNGVEIKINEMKEIKDGLSNEYTPDQTYCGIDFKIKNIYKEKQSITSFDFQMLQSDGTVINPTYLSDEANKIWQFQTVELEPNMESSKKISFDCKNAPNKPVTFVYTGGKYLNFSLFNRSDEFQAIKFKTSF